MKIAVLSGKGGAGKTLVAVNLASVINESIYVDCDVEEPNGDLFFKSTTISIESVFRKIPFVNTDLCTGCRICVDFCKFNALAYIGKQLNIMGKICHSCGGCVLFCPERALSETDKKIGRIEKGVSENVIVLSGRLEIGEVSGVPIIKKLLKQSKTENEKEIIIDCPPGAACSVMESIKDVDYCILVAEPTIFGEHNLTLVYNLVRLFKKPCGVVLNKCLKDAPNPSEEFCIKEKIPILLKIPFDSRLGSLNSESQIVARMEKMYQHLFFQLYRKISKYKHEAIINY